MPSNRLLVEAFLDTSDFVRGARVMIENLEKIQSTMSKSEIAKQNSQIEEFEKLTAKADLYTKALRELAQAEDRLKVSGVRTGKGLGSEAQQLLKEVTGSEAKAPRGTPTQLGDAVEKGQVAAAKLADELKEAGEAMHLLVSGAEDAEQILRFIGQNLEQQDAALASIAKLIRTGPQEAKIQISKSIEEEIRELQEQARLIETATAGQFDVKNRRALAKAPSLHAKARKHAEKAVELQQELDRLIELGNSGKLKGIELDENAAQVAALRISENLQQQLAASTREEAKVPTTKSQNLRQLTGVADLYDKIQNRIENLIAKQQELSTVGGFEKQNVEAAKLVQEMEKIQRLLDTNLLTDKERSKQVANQVQLEKQHAVAVKKAVTEAVAGNAKIPAAEVQKAVKSTIPLMNRLFTNAFNDIGKRFVTTLQFAISGALIFGVQKLVREFLDAAIDVQRAFKDIESALVFDIEFGRGTAKFNQEVEGVRQDVLLLSREFNVLPVDANAAAFVMVARFGDTANALRATRAQLLAVKVSAIDQSEVLRALTAVSETFAASVFHVNDGLSLQEKLLKREAVAADLYGQILDDAVRIQQQFGIEVEDTLEGTARAAESFRQMGFSLRETEAIVVSVSRQLGQTGQQSAEKLVRSLAQLTNPEIRESLLELAANSQIFTLSISDFADGATAWSVIADQFERIEKFDPSTAQTILQVIGQRREVEAVAAALGTRDLQKSIFRATDSAAGAAEERFSFLNATVSELLASLAAGFQELAQNFERLGGITALSLVLGGVNLLIEGINNLLSFLIKIRDIMDTWVIPLGTAVTKVVSLGLALLTVLRVAKALHETFLLMSATQVGGSLSTILAANSGIAAAASAGFTNKTKVLSGLPAGGASRALAGLTAGATQAGKGMLGLVKGALNLIPLWGKVAIVAGFLAFQIKGMIDQQRALVQAQEDYEEVLRDVTTATRERQTREDVDPDSPEGRNIAREETIAGLERQAENAVTARVSWFRGLLLILTEDDGLLGDTGILSRRARPERFAGSKEYYQGLIEEVRRLAAEAEIQAYRDAVADTEFTGVESTPELERDVENIFGIRVEGRDFHPVGLAEAEFNRLINDANARLADSSGNLEERTDRRETAEADIDSAISKYEAVLQLFGLLPDEMGLSVRKLDQKLAGLGNAERLGIDTDGFRVTAERATEILFESAERYQEAAEFYAKIGAEESAIEAAQKAQATLIQAYDHEIDRLLAASDERLVHHGAEEKLRGQIETLGARIDFLNEQGTVESMEEAARLQKRMAVLFDQELKAELAAAISMIEADIAMAQTFDERIRLGIILRALLVEQLDRYGGFSDAFDREKSQAIKQGDIDTAEAKLEEAIAKNTALVRLAAPALSGTAGFVTQIAELQARIKVEEDTTQKLILRQQLREVLGQAQQADLERLIALKLNIAGANDALTSQLIALSGLRQELILNAQLFGKTSKEYFFTALAIKGAEASIRDTVLQIESVNRQLAPTFDVTDPLHAAQEAFIVAARALKIPDLGDAERAAAELNLDNADATRIGAEYESALFNLQFQNERGLLSDNGYLATLQSMLSTVDISTRAGKELWLQINGLIEGMTDDISSLQFNIPGAIRLPTLFEVRRAVQAESLGVNYLDNRQQNINVYVSDEIAVDAVFEAIAGAFEVEDARHAPGGAGITIGQF